MKKRLLNKKGVAMVEITIAMAVVVLVTVTATSLIFISARTAQTTTHKAQAQLFAEDALTCFRAADSATQFGDAVEANGGFLEFYITGSKYVYTLKDSKYKAVAVAEYPTDGRASFSIQITDSEGAVIASIPRFEKGA